MATREDILQYIDRNDKLNTLQYSANVGEDHQKVVGVIKSLQGLGQLIRSEQVCGRRWQLTDEGQEVADSGSHEAKVFSAVPADGGVEQSQLMTSLSPGGKIGFSKALSCGWLALDKSSGGAARVVRKVRTVTDVVQHHLRTLSANPAADVSDKLKQEYKKRKLLQEITVKSYDVFRGDEFSLNVEKAETDLTGEMITSGEWRSKTFKPYNFQALGAPIARGHLHPLLKVRAEFRQIFLEMGFSEMPTNRYVESSFWNFDALFQPQQHPARDAQDTFFLTEPAISCQFPSDYVARVKRVHSVGGHGSTGYGSPWNLHDAQKNVLRTHTTAVSARMLYQLAQMKEFKPVRYFSIDRVFRNETLDATHLAEFHQIEGVVADRGLTLGHLMGVIHEFFKKLGIEAVRFKPAYNPYTEPSMEIFSWHPGLRRWVEVGNSGMFRPEMLLPMGLPADVNVIAWGLSLERPTMIKYKLDNIRDLCGHKVNLQMVADNPLCRLDKSDGGVCKHETRLDSLKQRQQALIDRLAGLQLMVDELHSVKSDGSSSQPDHLTAVLEADPQQAPLAVLALCRMLAQRERVSASCHVHSTVAPAVKPPTLLSLDECAGNAQFELTVVWKALSPAVPTMRVGRMGKLCVQGEAAICRLLARRLDCYTPFYADRAAVDVWLDLAELCAISQDSQCRAKLVTAVEGALSSRDWLAAGQVSLADVFVLHVLQRAHAVTDKMASWARSVDQL